MHVATLKPYLQADKAHIMRISEQAFFFLVCRLFGSTMHVSYNMGPDRAIGGLLALYGSTIHVTTL